MSKRDFVVANNWLFSSPQLTINLIAQLLYKYLSNSLIEVKKKKANMTRNRLLDCSERQVKANKEKYYRF